MTARVISARWGLVLEKRVRTYGAALRWFGQLVVWEDCHLEVQ